MRLIPWRNCISHLPLNAGLSLGFWTLCQLLLAVATPSNSYGQEINLPEYTEQAIPPVMDISPACPFIDFYSGSTFMLFSPGSNQLQADFKEEEYDKNTDWEEQLECKTPQKLACIPSVSEEDKYQQELEEEVKTRQCVVVTVNLDINDTDISTLSAGIETDCHLMLIKSPAPEDADRSEKSNTAQTSNSEPPEQEADTQGAVGGTPDQDGSTASSDEHGEMVSPHPTLANLPNKVMLKIMPRQ